jgi:hypothetical protein
LLPCVAPVGVDGAQGLLPGAGVELREASVSGVAGVERPGPSRLAGDDVDRMIEQAEQIRVLPSTSRISLTKTCPRIRLRRISAAII